MDGLATFMEMPTHEMEWMADSSSVSLKLDGFFRSLASAEKSALLLDFDGTLAPFRIDPTKVRPWAGVVTLLDKIRQSGKTRLAIITGRPALDVASQLSLRDGLEIWGLHGAQRLYSDGRLEQEELLTDQRVAIDAARIAIHNAKLGLRIEEKPNAVVVHWRGKSLQSARSLKVQVLNLLQPFEGVAAVRLLEFDGGIELRAGHDKGDTVRLILDEMPRNTPVAYLGDDVTDEDAFRALSGKGMGILIRREWRPSAAQLWLCPPVQLRKFLTMWLEAVEH